MLEINEGAETCSGSENHDRLRCDEVNNCKLDPARVQDARYARTLHFVSIHMR